MNKESMFEIIKGLPFDKEQAVFSGKGTEIYVIRPSKLSKRFKGYDKKKNFQIWLREEGREFKPNHLRIMIDLNLRVRARPDLKKDLLLAFDEIYYGKDPIIALGDLQKETFEHFLNDLRIIGFLAQLFHIEQEYAYHRESKFEPPNLFLQGWIREFIDSPKEIDNMCMSVCSGQPPKAQYVKLENKKDKKHTKGLKPLWYLQEVK